MKWALVPLLLGTSLLALAQVPPCQVQIIPSNPTASDNIVIKITGYWPTACPKPTYSLFIWGNHIWITGQVTDQFPGCLPTMSQWTITAHLGTLSPGTYWVWVNLKDPVYGSYGCQWSGSFTVQPGWPPLPPWPPTYPIPPDTAQLQAMLNKGPGYFAIAERANKELSPEQKAGLETAVYPILLQGQAVLGGPTAAPAIRMEPQALRQAHATLQSFITNLMAKTRETLGMEKAQELDLLKPFTELPLQAPHTHWACYWSYLYAWWTWFYAYWTYIVHDTPLAYWTMVYSYYSMVYAYYCYLWC